MGTYGGKYKREDGVKEMGRTQQPVYAGECKSATDLMFETLMEIIPENEKNSPDMLPPTFPDISKMTWAYGYDPKAHFVSQMPNGAPAIKLLHAGSVNWLMFEAKSLVAALKLVHSVDKIPLATVYEYIENLDGDKMKALKAKDAMPIYFAQQNALEAVYVPTGFLCVESSIKNAPLVYGVRKAFLLSSDFAVQNYEELIGCLVNGGKHVDKMNEALVIITPSTL